MNTLRIGLAVFALVALPAAGAGAASLRAYTIDDALGLESLGAFYGGPFAFAPDGKALAYTRVRSQDTLANLKWEYLWDNAGGDVWWQTDRAAEPVNLTRGVEDGSGWWAPQWSPDGRHLAMLSTRGGNVHIWLWDRRSGAVRRLSKRAVEDNPSNPYPQPFLWIDDERLIYPALPEGEQPLGMRIELQTPLITTREWPKVPAGKEVTASVLDSGVPPDLSKRPQSQLRLVNVVSGEETVMVDRSTIAWAVSPDRKAVAFARKTSVYTPKTHEALPFSTRNTFGLGLATLDGRLIEVAGEHSRDILPETLRWSPDGAELAFIGWPKDRSEAPQLFRLNLEQGHSTSQALGLLDAAPIARESPQLEWAGRDDLLLLAYHRRSVDLRPAAGDRRDWWLIRRDGAQRKLSAELRTPPDELWPEAGRETFVGLADGELWRVEPAMPKLENLTADFKPEISRIVWPAFGFDGTQEWPLRDRSYRSMAFAASTADGEFYHRIDLNGARVAALKSPAPDAELKGYEPQTGSAVFSRSDSRGLFLWRADGPTGETRELVAANAFLRGIRPAQAQSFDYTSLDGQPLKAWLLLPRGYKKGQRYPLLTWVYAGSMARRESPGEFDIGEGGVFNMQIAAARGYAVLKPSMPLAPEGAVGDPMMGLPNGVLPAVDKAIAMGIADPKRLFVMGQSYGGFSTYGLVAQTKRFAAAASLAGPTDLAGFHGSFDARMRYTDFPHENLPQAGIESGLLLMGGPPWADLGRYIRNSPLHFVDRVQTPLLIIHGDLDAVPIQQSEAFFNSLYRQGKRARFVRYWGEGHVLRSPANVRDMWERVFSWFEEFSPATSEPSQQSPSLR